MTPPDLRTARLQLRQIRQADAGAVIAALNEWEVTRWLTAVPFPYTADDFRWFMENMVADPAEFLWGIDHGTGLIGVIGIKPDLGYWLARPHHGQGLMTEAVEAVLNWYMPDRTETVVSGYHLGNAASCAVMCKFGFEDTDQVQEIAASTGKSVTIQRTELTHDRWQRLRSHRQ